MEAICTLCNHKEEPVRGSHGVRDGYVCSQCKASLRYRDIAACIVDEYGRGRSTSLARVIRQGLLDDVAVLEISASGPLSSYLAKLSGYCRAYSWPDAIPGTLKNKIRSENVAALTFPDQIFDLLVSVDVLDFQFDIEKVFKEFHRVLKPGGLHIFSVVSQWPLVPHSTIRARRKDAEIEYLHEQKYRSTPAGQQLVAADFGEDLIELSEACGFRTRIVRRSMMIDGAYQNPTFVSRRIGLA